MLISFLIWSYFDRSRGVRAWLIQINPWVVLFRFVGNVTISLASSFCGAFAESRSRLFSQISCIRSSFCSLFELRYCVSYINLKESFNNLAKVINHSILGNLVGLRTFFMITFEWCFCNRRILWNDFAFSFRLLLSIFSLLISNLLLWPKSSFSSFIIRLFIVIHHNFYRMWVVSWLTEAD